MRKHITFNGLSSCPTDHEAAEGDSAMLLNLIAEDGALHPITPRLLTRGTTPGGCQLAGIHQGNGYRHLILRMASDGTTHAYAWTDADAPLCLHPLYEDAEPMNAFAAVGDTLCMVSDSDTHYALWDNAANDYAVISTDDLLYDITLTQDNQQRCDVTLPITTTLATWLDSPTAVLDGRQRLAERMFPDFYATDDAYATGATMVAAMMASAADNQAARLGQGTHHNVRFGIAALRMADGSHMLCSNIFALLPAAMPHTITADREAGTLHATTYMHRHTITIDMRQGEKAAKVITGVDIFLTRELTMLDIRQAATIVSDMEGRTTALTFAQKGRQAVADAFDNLIFYKAMTIGHDQWGTPLLVPQADATGEAIDLGDLRRWGCDAKVACDHDNRLSIAAVARRLRSPFSIGLTYRYLTLDATARLALDPAQRDAAIESEGIAGSRADIADNPLGQRCDVVVCAKTTHASLPEVWWRDEVQYPIPGMMMVAADDITQLTYHVRLATSNGTHYFTTTQHLDRLRQKGIAMSVHTASGGAHRVERDALHSLLLQQAAVLSLDTDSGIYHNSFMLWQNATAEEWEAQAERARAAWMMPRDTSLILTSAKDNPFVFPTSAAVHVGSGEVTQLVSNTRRTADGLFGDGQYYAFTTQGIWVMRLSKERWQAQQTVTRQGVAAGAHVATTDDAVVYPTPRGLMTVKGSTSTCLSDALLGESFHPTLLPHLARIIATEPTLDGIAIDLPTLTREFIPHARIHYDATHHRLWLHHPDCSLGLVYSLRSKQWGAAVTAFDSSISDGDTTWVLRTTDGIQQLARVDYDGETHGRAAVMVCSRPLSLSLRHVPKTALRVMVRGLFCHRGPGGSHVGVALYGSDDLAEWHYIGSSANQYLRFRSGRPYQWFRVIAIGQLLPGESIEGVSVEFCKRLNNKTR